jgi:uncharacterized protein (TIGR00297 family)
LTALTPLYLFYAGLLAAGISLAAWLLRLLSYSGALAAFAVGFFIFGFGGLPFAIPLLVFFFSSSLLSRVGRARKARRLNALYEKTATRDAGQVLANGSIPALLAFLYARSPSTQTWLLCLASLAAVNADTWATEIGGLAPGRPRLVTTYKQVEPGTSGAVSFLGLVAALLGSLAVVLAGWLAWPPYTLALMWRFHLPEALAVLWAGFVAAFGDSILGASAQAQYKCAQCGVVTERAGHCNRPACLVRGFRWINNDVVNFLTGFMGAFFAWILLTYCAGQG